MYVKNKFYKNLLREMEMLDVLWERTSKYNSKNFNDFWDNLAKTTYLKLYVYVDEIVGNFNKYKNKLMKINDKNFGKDWENFLKIVKNNKKIWFGFSINNVTFNLLELNDLSEFVKQIKENGKLLEKEELDESRMNRILQYFYFLKKYIIKYQQTLDNILVIGESIE